MKILAIRGKNLASLEGAFGIDFTVEPLLSAGIFAICGPTGAGKSTLLDALCLALFGRTPRTELAKENNVKLKDVQEDMLMQNDPRFLLRRGTSSGYAEADFMALNGSRYRSRWAVSRAREKENGRLQNARLTLYNLDKQAEEPGTRSDLQARVIDLIGLTFEQFTRSVLLAQNDFSTFLKAEQGEKASLLEKLTGTEQYSAISRLIFRKNSEAKEAYEKVAGRIQGIELLTEEEEAGFRSRLTEAERRLAQLEEAKTQRQTLQEAVKSVEHQLQTKQHQHKEAFTRWQQAQQTVATASQEYAKGKEEQTLAETRFKALQAELQQARRLDIQLEPAARTASEAASQWKHIQTRCRENEAKLQQVELQWKQGAEEIRSLTVWRDKYRSKEGIAEQLSALLLHLDAALSARQSIEKSKKTLVNIGQEEARIAVRLTDVVRSLETTRLSIRQTDEAYQQLFLQQKETDLASLKKETETLRTEREHLLIEQARGDIGELRKRLKKGFPCPVCGSLHHPVVDRDTSSVGDLFAEPAEKQPSAEDIYQQQISLLTLRLQEMAARTETYQQREKQIAALQQQQLAWQKRLAENEQARTDLLGRQKLLAGQRDQEAGVQKEQSDVLTRSLEAADALFGNTSWQAGWQNDPVAFRKTLTDFAREWKERQERLRVLEQQQTARQAEYDSFASFRPALQKEYETIRLDYEKKQEVLRTLQTERRALLSGRPVEEVEKEYTHKMDVLNEQLKKLETIRHEQSLIAEQSRGIADQIARDQAELTEALALHRKNLEEWQEAYRQSSDGVSLEDAWALANRQKTEAALRLRMQEENKRKVAGWQGELNCCRETSERWAKLNDLAGSADGAKFRRIAQGYTLDVLLSYTNVQLRQLTHRYRLERVPDTLALQVIDRDMCDEIRTVHSLSGGESFLVSLALALGLSSLSANRMKVESLFIDEGFGSLDAETLRVAMDALESLRTQGRKIGVISHVQEMTERIPVRIRVNRAGNGRSYLEIG